jgi:hypothetical protein
MMLMYIRKIQRQSRSLDIQRTGQPYDDNHERPILTVSWIVLIQIIIMLTLRNSFGTNRRPTTLVPHGDPKRCGMTNKTSALSHPPDKA